MTARVSCSSPSGPHMWPEVRIIAGIEASTMTSLGTCRFVMPLSELTIARRGPSARPLVDGGLDLVAVGQGGEAVEDAAEAVVGGQAGGGEVGAVGLEDLGEERLDDVAEDDRVADLHHRGLEVHREQHVVGLGAGDLVRRRNASSAADAQHGGVDDLALEHRQAVLEHGGGAVGGDVADGEGVVGAEHDRLLVVAEVVDAHRRDVGLAVGAPGAHRVRVLAGVVLHRRAGRGGRSCPRAAPG